MSDVARRAGVSDGLPYHHFGSKAGALSAVIDDFYDRYYAVVNQPLDGSRPWAERELERLRSWLAFLYGEPLAPIVLGRMGRTAQVAGLESSRQDQLIGLARRNIELGQRAGDISETIDAGIAAAAIIGAIRQAASQAFQDPEPPAAERPRLPALGADRRGARPPGRASRLPVSTPRRSKRRERRRSHVRRRRPLREERGHRHDPAQPPVQGQHPPHGGDPGLERVPRRGESRPRGEGDRARGRRRQLLRRLRLLGRPRALREHQGAGLRPGHGRPLGHEPVHELHPVLHGAVARHEADDLRRSTATAWGAAPSSPSAPTW